jgi:IS4 transposase
MAVAARVMPVRPCARFLLLVAATLVSIHNVRTSTFMQDHVEKASDWAKFAFTFKVIHRNGREKQ